MLDPVRFLSNVSTGEMGFALARVAREMNYDVTLIYGPTVARPPLGIKTISIVSAKDLKDACERVFRRQDALVMTAAVCDFTARSYHLDKIHRTKTKHLQLKQTPDIVSGLARRKGKRVVIGFCLETRDWIGNARRKLIQKNLDGIVANYYRPDHIPFGDRRITVAFLDRNGSLEIVRRASKKRIAARLLRWMERIRGDMKNRFRKKQR